MLVEESQDIIIDEAAIGGNDILNFFIEFSVFVLSVFYGFSELLKGKKRLPPCKANVILLV